MMPWGQTTKGEVQSRPNNNSSARSGGAGPTPEGALHGGGRARVGGGLAARDLRFPPVWAMDGNEERWWVEPTRCGRSGRRRSEGGTMEAADLAGGGGGLFPRSASPYAAASSTFCADELAPEGSAEGMVQPRAPEGRPRARVPPRASSTTGELLLACALPRAAPPRLFGQRRLAVVDGGGC
jgi:hypothetical protein